MEEKRKAYRILVGKLTGKKPHGRLGVNVRITLKES
jgi:hypothetical protein